MIVIGVDSLGSASVLPGWATVGRTTCSGSGTAAGVDASNGAGTGPSAQETCATGGLHAPVVTRRQKSCDELDPAAVANARAQNLQKGTQLAQIQVC